MKSKEFTYFLGLHPSEPNLLQIQYGLHSDELLSLECHQAASLKARCSTDTAARGITGGGRASTVSGGQLNM